MSVNIFWNPITNPQPVNSVQNTAIYYVASSTNTGYPNFKYNWSIKIKGKTYTYKTPPAPVTGYGQMAFSDVIKSYVSYDLLPTIGRYYQGATNSYATFSVCCTEEYDPLLIFANTFNYSGSLGLTFSYASLPHGLNIGDVITIKMDDPFLNADYNGSATITAVPTPKSLVVDKDYGFYGGGSESGTITNVIFYSGTTCSNVGMAWNGNRQYLDGSEVTNDFNQFYNAALNGGRKFLSNYNNVLNSNTNNPENFQFPSLKPVFCLDSYPYPSTTYSITQYETLSWITDTPYTNSYYNQVQYRLLFNDGSTNTVTVSIGSSASTIGQQYFTANVGPQALNNTIYSAFYNVKNFYVRLLSNFGTIWSEWRGYTVVCNCSPYENWRIYFQNNLGAFDFWNFNYISRETYNVDRTTYDKTLAYNWKWGDRGKTMLSQKVTETVYLSSDWIDEEQSKYLKELIYSPEVYWIKDSTTAEFKMIPLIINTNSYEIKTNLKDGLFCISFEAEVAVGISTQNN